MLLHHARRNILIYLILFSLLLFPTKSLLAQGQVVIDTVYSNSLEGNFLEDSPNRIVGIYLPPDYNTNTQTFYPVIYLLHGYTHNHLTWLKNGSLGMDIRAIMDNLIGSKTIQPMIIVMPNGYNKYQGCWYANSDVTGNWEDFIVKDLVSHVEESYRAIAQTESRGIAGHSMGGTGSFKIAMKHPDVYSSVFSLSAGNISFEYAQLAPEYKPYLIAAVSESNPARFNSLYWRTRVAIAAAAAFAPNKNHLPYYGDFPVDESGALIDSIWAKWLEHDAYTMIESYKTELSLLDGIWIDCGTQDDLYNSNYQVSLELDSTGITHTWSTYAGGHVDKIGDRIEEKMLPFFSEKLITSVDHERFTVPATYILLQNYPNPFNPVTAIGYRLSAVSEVELTVYNLIGQKVATLVSEKQNAGSYQVEWDASGFSSGLYYYQITAGSYFEVKKMILLK